jgi:hypothetical protein
MLQNCSSLASITIPKGVTSISGWVFKNCSSLTSVTFANTSGWKVGDINVDVSNPANNAVLLTSTYVDKYWKRT